MPPTWKCGHERNSRSRSLAHLFQAILSKRGIKFLRGSNTFGLSSREKENLFQASVDCDRTIR
jgi:hypothetical protein